MDIARINVSVIDGTRPFAETPFHIPLILGCGTNPEIVKDTIKTFSSDDLTAVATYFPVGTPEYKAAVSLLSQDPHPNQFYIYSFTRGATPDPTDWSTAFLAALQAIEDAKLTAPYFVAPAAHEDVEEDTAELADAVGAKTMVMMAAHESSATAAELVARAAGINSDRCVIVAHKDADNEWPEMALMGLWAGLPVGSLTLDTKALNGVAASAWTSADYATFQNNFWTAGAVIPYMTQAGVPVTIGSMTTSGAYADIRRCKDWLIARMREALFRLKLQNLKIPQTAHGANMVRHGIEGVLNRAADMGIVQQRAGVGRWEIDIPTLSWLADNDPTALTLRHLRTIRVRVWPEGAWEAFTVLIYHNWESPSV